MRLFRKKLREAQKAAKHMAQTLAKKHTEPINHYDLSKSYNKPPPAGWGHLPKGTLK